MITIPEAARLLGLTYRSAQLNVRKLIEANILAQIGEADYGRTYVANEILELIDTSPD